MYIYIETTRDFVTEELEISNDPEYLASNWGYPYGTYKETLKAYIIEFEDPVELIMIRKNIDDLNAWHFQHHLLDTSFVDDIYYNFLVNHDIVKTKPNLSKFKIISL